MSKCEWSGCDEIGTHKLEIHFPDLADETWLVCRDHEDELKLLVVRTRPKKPQPVDAPVPPPAVHCAGCGQLLAEHPNVAQRTPCLSCGSLGRNIALDVADSVTMHSSVGSKLERAGSRKGEWAVKTVGGDSYTRDLEAWGTFSRTMSQETDSYREVIELWDGTRIESSARLTDHPEPTRRQRPRA